MATLAVRAFQEGYDARFGIAMSLPVLLCELLVRFIWMIKQRFYFKKPLKECIPTQSHTDLRIMLLFGHGTLCLMDGADALVRSGGNWLMFFTRMNIIAWGRFTVLVLKEINLIFRQVSPPACGTAAAVSRWKGRTEAAWGRSPAVPPACRRTAAAWTKGRSWRSYPWDLQSPDRAPRC